MGVYGEFAVEERDGMWFIVSFANFPNDILIPVSPFNTKEEAEKFGEDNGLM